jgi:CRISPR-associated protein Cas2
MLHLLVSYDVCDDRKRTRLAKYLTGYLDRVQKSVFEGAVDESKLELLRVGIGQRIDRDVDSVRIYTLCARCCRVAEVIGCGTVIGDERGDVVV